MGEFLYKTESGNTLSEAEVDEVRNTTWPEKIKNGLAIVGLATIAFVGYSYLRRPEPPRNQEE